MTDRPHQDDDAAFILTLFADGIAPDPRRSVSEWADAERMVTEGSHEGPWRTDRTPYLREPMDKLTLSNPARRVTLKASAQIGKTQCGLNLIGQILAETPAKVLVVLPSLNTARMYNRDKLDPMIRNTQSLNTAVADITSRDGVGSTTTVKRGQREAQVELVTASSSKDLQSRTVRVVIFEEISEYPTDVDGRGDPVDLAMARTIQWRSVGEKVFDCSTPGIKGACRVTKFYEAGSRARFLVHCPFCGHHQPLVFAQLNWPQGEPDKAAYACAECGVLIPERYKREMLAHGAWEHDRPALADRHPSYAINILYSPFTPWAEVAREAEKAAGDATLSKAFHQQWLGEAWDAAHDLPKADILLLRRDKWPRGRVPAGVLFLMGATDVQGEYLEWAVYGFDRNFTQWLIDTGTLAGDPSRPEVWRAHDELIQRSWEDAWGKSMTVEAWGIDSGYLSSHVYAYCRRHGPDRKPEVRALDGRKGWNLPPIGRAKPVSFDWNGQKLGTFLFPVGTWDLKSELASALRTTEQGPGPDGWPAGAVRFNEIVDRAWLEQMLSEQHLIDPRTGDRSWIKVARRNEAWDLAVYTRGLARHAVLQLTDEDWAELTASRQGPPEDAQSDLVELWAPDLKAEAVAALQRAAATPAATPDAAAVAPVWIDDRQDWFGREERWH